VERPRLGRRDNDVTARRGDARNLSHHGVRVKDMFDHLGCHDGIERSILERKMLDISAHIRRRDVVGLGIDPHDARCRCAHQALVRTLAATEVKSLSADERDGLAERLEK
jgi:hypothetical protein